MYFFKLNMQCSLRHLLVWWMFMGALYYSAQAQEKQSPVNFPTPEVAGLGQYGETPVGHFTGTPNISIPIYTIQDGDIQVPISLSYHPGSVKVNSHPGWVGLGWNLIVGGNITRTQRGGVDEARRSSSGNDNEPGFINSYTQHQLYTNIDWTTRNNLKVYAAAFVQPLETNWETMADEFSFNFMGYSGKFYWGPGGQIKVIAEQPIKVELVDMINFTDPGMRPVIRENISQDALRLNTRVFNRFKITTPNGMVYWFGGEAQRAIEYSVPYRSQANTPPTATTWHLTKITSPTGREVTFYYEDEDEVTRRDQSGNNVKVKVPRLTCSLFQGYGFEKVAAWSTFFDPGRAVDDFLERLDQAKRPKDFYLGVPLAFIESLNRIRGYAFTFLGKDRPSFATSRDRLNTNTTNLAANSSINGFLMFPSYLSRIEFSKGKIDFLAKPTSKEGTLDDNAEIPITSTELRYHDNYLALKRATGATNTVSGPYQYLRPKFSELSIYERSQLIDVGNSMNGYVSVDGIANFPTWATRKIQWHQLDRIILYDHEERPVREFDFRYTESADTRLKLLSLQEVGKKLKTRQSSDNGGRPDLILTNPDLVSSKYNDYEDDRSKPPYQFIYNSRSLPPYCSDKIDHWGFHNDYHSNTFDFNAFKKPLGNGKLDIDLTVIDTYIRSRAADRTGDYSKAELLEKIVYPTRGFTQLIYEPHRFSKVVNVSRDGLKDSTDVAGGVRIKKVSDYTREGVLANSREFYYVKGYTQGVDPANLTSSGILASQVEYTWDYNYLTEDENITKVYKFSSDNMYLPGFNTPGNHIGYSEVVEVQKNAQGIANGYTKHTFTNFDTDIWGNSHFDEPFVAFLDNMEVQEGYLKSAYLPFTSKALERGKSTSVTLYNNQNQVVRDTRLKYVKSNPDPQSNYLRTVYHQVIDDISTGGVLEHRHYRAAAYKIYDYTYQVVEKLTTDYSQGADRLASTTKETFIYDQHKLLREHKALTGLGETSSTYTRYLSDYTTLIDFGANDQNYAALRDMQQRHMIGVPLEVITKKNGRVIGGKYTAFKKHTTASNQVNIYPYQVYALAAKEPLTISNQPGSDVFNFMYTQVGNTRIDNHYGLPEVTFDSYDDQGHILAYHTRTGEYVNFHWGNDYPVIKSMQAQASLVWFNGFEFDNHTSIRDSRDLDQNFTAHSGFKVWLGDSYTISGLNANADTKMSYWYYMSADNKWHFSGEQDFNNTIQVTGAIMLDDIRVYQKDAQVMAYTYQPLVGINSQTDINNRVMKYHHDALGRLMATRDFEGNILNKHQYVYRNIFDADIDVSYTKCTTEGNFANFVVNLKGYTGPANYIWDMGDGSPKRASNSNKYTYTYQKGGTYQIKVTVTAVGYYPQTFTAFVNIKKPLKFSRIYCDPTLDISGTITDGECGYEKCAYDENDTFTNLKLHAAHQDGVGDLTFKWYYSTTGQNGTWVQFVAPNDGSAQAPYKPASYWVRCLVTDSCGNSKSVMKYIDVTNNGTCE
ncbi:hypothetical protein BKI52_03295 [marine bacterium AO1-C]|nr:hypothetical protein BKI52_03295 [marine bacterium AO1-C]